MLVLRRVPKDVSGADRFSPWKGCLYVDQDNNGAWYATGLAKPTQFDSIEEAEDVARVIRKWSLFSESEIQVAVYEEIFREPLPIPISDIRLAAATVVELNKVLTDWNWNKDEPF